LYFKAAIVSSAFIVVLPYMAGGCDRKKGPNAPDGREKSHPFLIQGTESLLEGIEKIRIAIGRQVGGFVRKLFQIGLDHA
jgi:hypothetical protein